MKIKKFKIRASAASQLLTASGRNAKPSGKYGISVGTETLPAMNGLSLPYLNAERK
jgi:hypothetical protein